MIGSDSSINKIWQHHYTNGDSWIFMGYTVWVEYLGMVNVPAGNFDLCYFVHLDSVSGWVFAPNVGIIKSIQDNNDLLVLRDYNVEVPGGLQANKNFNDMLKIFPNPTIDKITLELQWQQHVQKNIISIYNIQGQTILQQPLQQEKTDIDISELAKGVYILKLNSNDKTEVKKFIKE